MNKLKNIQKLREHLKNDGLSIGSWMQIPSPSVAEILGHAGYDWVAVDMEHGAISVHQLPDLFRALELGDTLPLVRLAQGHPKDCKQAMDAGAGGVIVPMIENAEQLISVRDACRWPPAGKRGVGFSRANLFGKNFVDYYKEAQVPLLVAMIESIAAVDQLDEIFQVSGLDAVLIGPYDLSASMGLTAQFDHSEFHSAMDRVRTQAEKFQVPCGVHVVTPSEEQLEKHIQEGYRFVAYSIDAVFLNTFSLKPKITPKR
jgi:2-dehydro-3-deoxyglucarate aldolase